MADVSFDSKGKSVHIIMESADHIFWWHISLSVLGPGCSGIRAAAFYLKHYQA